ncbi:aldose epimerase family protein [Ideonella alba]|uniref:Aldose 1-epimerase n=1 Tax=Ideonella alba TaxID=2824118 RepID=A0A940Y378_9BURK|nr:aldose epimerase family protein [Ideonella alba]MBQ0928897.1 galactose mutarotase [Ideonella alba]
MNPAATVPGVRSAPWARLADGRPVTAWTLDAGGQLQLTLLDLGGTVVALRMPDRHGHFDNIVLALASPDDQLRHNPTFGSLVGRYANRIADSRFMLDGRRVDLDSGGTRHCLHGGAQGFGARFWQVAPGPRSPDGAVAVVLRLDSPDGDQGFPGRLSVEVRYTLTPDDCWIVDYSAHTDRPTVLNLTQHAYWNLAGCGAVDGHRLTLVAGRYLPIDAEGIPQHSAPVDGTPLDFRGGAVLGPRLRTVHPQLQHGRGLDHYLWVDRSAPGLALAARLEDPVSGRVLEVETTEPGLQVYSANWLDGRLAGTHGDLLRAGDALCLETQHPADAPNRPDFPSTVLRPGQTWHSRTLHRLRCLR